MVEDKDPLLDFEIPLHGEFEDPYDGFEEIWHYPNNDREFVSKRWGCEEIIVNNDKYCGKILTIYSGCKTSYHKHHLKDETFRVMSGVLVVYYGDETEVTGVVVLSEGHSFRMMPGVCHCLACAKDRPPVRFIEFSTTDSPDDSYRVKFPTQRRA